MVRNDPAPHPGTNSEKVDAMLKEKGRIEPTPTKSGAYDPIMFSVIMSRFESIANEMTLTLERSAWTSILALCRDFSCAIYDGIPRQICMLDAIPIHTTSLQLVLQDVATTFESEVADGDIYFCNDPYRGNTHVGDLVTACPVFVDGRHMFWAATRGHQMDTGAMVASSVTAAAQNVWQEGLTIPPVKLCEAGALRQDVLDLYLSNLRYREALEGDLLAQLGSIEKGRQRLIELCGEYGPDVISQYLDAMVEYADRRMADLVSTMPDGSYEGEGWVDSDGIDRVNIPIRARVTIKGDQITVDYSDSGLQAAGGLNGSEGTSRAAAAIPFLYYVDPDIPHNEGCIRHIDVVLREGTICHPRFPASTSAATIVPSDMMQDAVNRAMAACVPDLVIAGSTRCANVPQFAGIDEQTGEAWGVMFFNNSGGSGAVKGFDGWPLWESQAAAGALKDQAIEQIELLYPVMIDAWEIEQDSMGFGQWIGGPGNRFVVRPLAGSAECITFGDGCVNPPHGVLGGTPAIGGGQFVESFKTGRRRFVGASGHLHVSADERWVGVSTGGGGYGKPVDRDPAQVKDDVAAGIISYRAAREVFGVALIEDDGLPALDRDATDLLRGQLRLAGRPLIDPTTPAASTWIAENMREGDTYLLNPTP